MSTEHSRPAVDTLLRTLQGPDTRRESTASSAPTGTHIQDHAVAGQEPGAAQVRMRSSIACVRCRRSKVKCVNNGVGTACRSCENSGRECKYPAPVTTSTRRRESFSGRGDGYGDGTEKRQRVRKSAHTGLNGLTYGLSDSPRPLLDALDSRLLTPTVWQELFEFFQIHFSADLPFLHPPTFLKPLRQAAQQLPTAHPLPNALHSSPRPPASPEFLLAFLALVARFHPKLVAHHSPPTSSRPSNPLIASEYYAAAATERLNTNWIDNTTELHDVERVQAMLMLGLHEWGMCRGAKAWLVVGTAIRQAQALGLQYEMDLDDEPLSRSLALSGEAERLGLGARSDAWESEDAGDAFIQQEIRRRSFWSCFIMDRYLSSGKYRPQMLQARELRIQLPASERSFLFGEKVRTLMLGEEEHKVAGREEVENHRQASVLLGTTGIPEKSVPHSPKDVAMNDQDEDQPRLETGADEGLVSRYIKILEIYGRVVKWSCAGGRRTEEHPPWDSRCEFFQLNKQCLDFKASLPRQHTLTPQNTQAHISLKTSTPYLLIHTVYSLCQIALHREYVPFIPIRCEKPEGPLDPPLFAPDKHDVPAGFWEKSAKELFKAGRDVIDLVRSCQEWSALVETPIVGFAIYTVAFTGVYCISFPQMDPNGYLCTPLSQRQQADGQSMRESKGFEASRKALEMLGHMQTKLHMAHGWFETINHMHRYFRRMKKDYKRNIAAMESNTSSSDSPASTRHLSLREGGIGGGLDEFKMIERTLKEFGSLEDQDLEMHSASHKPTFRALDNFRDDSGSGTSLKSEDGDRPQPPSSEPRPTESGQWNAINAGPGPAATHDIVSHAHAPANGHFRPYDAYSRSPSLLQIPGQHTYAQQINNFRPAYSQDSASAAPPSLTSPGSHSATDNSNPSPPFGRGNQQYPNHQMTNSTYALHGPGQPLYGAHPQQQSLSIPSSAWPTPATVQHSQMPPPPPTAEAQQPWDHTQREAWFNSIPTRFGGDDLAAFTDGGELSDWAAMAAKGSYDPGWLTTIWNGVNNGGP